MNNIIINDKTLVSQVNKNTDDITLLKSNLKWIYQYGGVGGSGGYGPGGGNQSWSIYATLDGQIITDNSTIILNNEDENGNKIQHTLVISISKPYGLSYTIKSIRYFNGSDIITQNNVAKLYSGKYEYIYSRININGNAFNEENKLQIVIDCDDDPEPKYLSCYTICNPLTATSSFQTYNNGIYKPIANKDEIYVSTINNLFFTINYSLYISQSSTAKLVLNTTSNIIKNMPENNQEILTNNTGILRYEIDNTIFTNPLYYGYNNINAYLEINDGSEKPKVIDLSSSFTFVPTGLFLRVHPHFANNKIYSNIEDISLKNTFNTGLLYFDLTGYYNAPNNRTFLVSCIKTKIGEINSSTEYSLYDHYTLPTVDDFKTSMGLMDNEKNILNTNKIPELSLTTTYLNIEDSGIYILNFLIGAEENGNITYSNDIYRYYIGVSQVQNITNWIENIELEQLSSLVDEYGNKKNTLNLFNNAISSDYSFYYRLGTGENQVTNNIKNQVKQYGNYITVNSNNPSDIVFSVNSHAQANEQYVINIGIQYSGVNDFNNEIFSICSSDSSSGLDIIFYQNKVILNNSELKIYIPIIYENYNPDDQSQYHLISIVRQSMSKVNSAQYSYVIYIDGIPEIALPDDWVSGVTYTNLKLHSGNYSINLIDFANITSKLIYNQETYYLELNDTIISEYYLQYKSKILNQNIDDEQLINSINTLNLSKYFIFENNVIKVKDGLATLQSLKKELSDVHLMLFDITSGSSTNYNTENGFFNDFFFKDASQIRNTVNFNNLYYDKFSDNDVINIPNGHWSIEPQGSSTLTYKIKNLELTSVTDDTDEDASMYIFSPNFDEHDTNTYLPEVSFTLKADEMDSSHCNNTSVGLFVNKNTEKFADVINVPNNNSSRYKNYIKNCLLGYPCLLFIQLNNNETNTKEIYYLGIYNFNLGRKSYFNLGYRDTNILDNITAYNHETNSNYSTSGLRNGFNIYNIKVSAINKINENICVAEIQGNDSRFDFSQYDKSILFDQSENNKIDNYYMLGDIVPNYSGKPDKISEQQTLLSNTIKSITLAGGFIFDVLKKGMSNSIDDEYGYKQIISYDENGNRITNSAGYGYKTVIDEEFPEISKNMVPNYHYQSIRTLDGNNNIYTYNHIENATENDLVTAIYGSYSESTNELQTRPILDYRSLVEYYVICMALGMVDSVQKNLNLKSWTADQVKTNDNPNALGARFYAAFYDMDTSNGKTNSGGETNKYAFSDYWVTLHQNKENNELESSNIFRDFFPSVYGTGYINEKPGYDIPSSYLFAIAKYAALFNGIETNQNKDHITRATQNLTPENLWAHYRQPNGELRSAEYFIDNYFYININKIPIQLIALNYRFKYLQIANNKKSFDSGTIKKFSGLGKNYAKDWLNDRFHILDAYFNLQQENRKVLYYDYDILANTDLHDLTNLDSITKQVSYNNTPLYYNSNTNNPEGYEVRSDNHDIYVINHIFNSTPSEPIKCVMSSFSISAFNMSPLIIKSTNNTIAGSFIIPESTKSYYIEPNNLGSNENWTFGGSQLWIEISDIAPFISETGFYINSQYIRKLSGSTGSCHTWQIYCASLQELSLNNISYSGILDINCMSSNPNAIYYQNLKKIDLNGSKISLQCINSNCISISYDNVTLDSNNSSVKIEDCNLLENLSMVNLTANKLTLKPIYTRDFTLTSCKIKQVELSTRFQNSSISILNISQLQKVDIQGNNEGTISTLIINNCQNLQELYIYNYYSTSITKLIIKNCDLDKLRNTNNELIYIEKEPTGRINSNGVPIYTNILHLEKLTNLKYLSLENTIGFDIVVLPSTNHNEIELLQRAFSNTNVKYINFVNKDNKNHKLVLCGTNDTEHPEAATFYNTPFYLLSNYTSGEVNNLYFKVKQEPISLANIFKLPSQVQDDIHKATSNIKYITAFHFIKNLENKEWVTSLKGAFYKQNINYRYDDEIKKYYIDNVLISSVSIPDLEDNYDDNSKHLSFNGYDRLISVNQIFDYTNVAVIDHILFNGVALGVNTFDIMNCVSSKNLKLVHFHALDDIKSKITGFLFDEKENESSEIRLAEFSIYDDNSLINIVNVHDFIFGDYENTNFKDFCGFNIKTNKDDLNKTLFCKLNLNNLFTNNQRSIKRIFNVFTNLNQAKDSCNIYVGSSIEPQKCNLTIAPLVNITHFNNAFRVPTSISTDKYVTKIEFDALIDIINFFKWDIFQFKILYNNLPDKNLGVFNFYTKVNLLTIEDQRNWNNIWQNYITSVAYLFRRSFFIVDTSVTPSLELIYQIPGDPDYDNTDDIIISLTTFGSVFGGSTAFEYKNGTYEEIGIKLSNTTFKNIPNVNTISYTFSSARLNGRDEYPIPEDLLKPFGSNLTNCTSAFSNCTIIGNLSSVHTTYVTTPEYYKDVYYNQSVNIGNKSGSGYIANPGSKFSNYKLTSIEEYEVGSLSKGWPCIPPKLFYYNTELKDVTTMFYSTNIEGYLPEDLFINNRLLTTVTKFVQNCKILPRLISSNVLVNDEKDILNYDNNMKIYSFIPENFLVNTSCTNIGGLLSFKLLVSKSPLDRLYLMTDSILGNNDKTLYLSGITLQATAANENIVGEGEDKKREYLSTHNRGFINICINKTADNKYYEGIDIDKIKFSTETGITNCLLNSVLSNVYYGYIFKRGTLFTQTQIQNLFGSSSSFILFDAGKTITSSKNSGVQTILSLSQDIIYPAIINYKTYINDMLATQYITRGKRKDQIKNKYFINQIFNFKSDNHTIEQHITLNLDNTFDQIDLSCFDNIIKDGNNNIINATNITYTYNSSKTIAQVKEELELLVYMNYYALFNEWKLSDSEGTILLCYPYFRIKKDNTWMYLKDPTDKNNSEKQLKLQYSITYYTQNNTKYVDTIA